MENSKRKIFTLLALALLATPQMSCVMVGGYTSKGGWFLWPGSWIGILIMLLIFTLGFFLRR